MDTLLLLRSILHSDFLSFYLMSFSIAGSHLGQIPHYISLSCLLRLLWATTVSQTSLIVGDLDSLKNLIWYFVEWSSIVIFLMFFSWLDWGFVFWEENYRYKEPFSSCLIKARYMLSIWLITVDINLVERVFASFVYHKVTLFLPFPYYSLQREVPMDSPHLRRGSYTPLLWGGILEHLICIQTRSRISHFSKEPWLLLLENSIRDQDLGSKCAHWYCGVLASRASADRTKTYMCIH